MKAAKRLVARLLFKRRDTPERDRRGVRQLGAEALPPESIAHQRKRPAGTAVERAFGIEQAGAAGGGASELDGGLDAFAARAAKERSGQAPAGAPAQTLGQFTGQLRHMALQHGGAVAIQFLLQRRDDGGMVVSGVVDAIARQKIEDAAAIGRKQFRPEATLVGHVHLQQVQQADPLRIDVLRVAGIDTRNRQR